MRGVITIDITLNINSNGKIKVGAYIAERCNISRSKAQRLIQNGQVRLLGVPIINNDHMLKPDEECMVHLTSNNESISIKPNHDIKLNIIHKDKDIIVLNKQSKLTVYPCTGINNNTLLMQLLLTLVKSHIAT